MSREKKESVSVCIRMEKRISDLLSNYCEMTGLSKTVAIERSVILLVENYEKEQALLADARTAKP